MFATDIKKKCQWTVCAGWLRLKIAAITKTILFAPLLTGIRKNPQPAHGWPPLSGMIEQHMTVQDANPAAAAPAVSARGLIKRFETTVAVDGVDLTVDHGEVRGLLGPNGAGKTTLLRMLFGLVRPDAGSVELFGRPAGDPEAIALDGVAGFVETPSFYPYLSGRANLEVLAELDGEDALGRIDDALERVGLITRAADRVSGYSTGMLQRLGIAASLLRAPRLLLLDEPTAGLDPAGVRDIAALIRELSETGVGVLLSSHQIDEIEEACDSFTVLRQGTVVWEGTADELRAQAPPSGYQLHTSEDVRALELLAQHARVNGAPGPNGGISITAEPGALDQYVLALGAAGVAVRRLELTTSPLESMFFRLTDR
jgi:ABC-2 type transport system ATP-binding protein